MKHYVKDFLEKLKSWNFLCKLVAPFDKFTSDVDIILKLFLVSALSGAIFLCRVKANVWNMIQRFMIFTFSLLLGNVSGESWNTIAPIRNNCSQCPFVYNLVCGQDGKMYSSQCIAICRDVVSLLKRSLRNKSQFGCWKNKTRRQLIFWHVNYWLIFW